MSWNDYRAAMDELPISENFEDRICAAVREARREDAKPPEPTHPIARISTYRPTPTKTR